MSTKLKNKLLFWLTVCTLNIGLVNYVNAETRTIPENGEEQFDDDFTEEQADDGSRVINMHKGTVSLLMTESGMMYFDPDEGDGEYVRINRPLGLQRSPNLTDECHTTITVGRIAVKLYKNANLAITNTAPYGNFVPFHGNEGTVIASGETLMMSSSNIQTLPALQSNSIHASN